ncbi:MAG: hypothetical protein GWN01_02170 [Nitrosopumilaceae archaeon]|nr:hypothetical protein [Nitrosopumilaceae archaeon]NIU86114.1 hypothetical protein [Nitrosopumilaceae archaeon]NIV64916.1 hypothetical protein [Nitrosopumilaceae archaeon]NIX60382.1 hypothetical protein [Nitrosopumilaceae archaeon]
MKTMTKETNPAKITPDVLKELQKSLNDNIKDDFGGKERKNGKKGNNKKGKKRKSPKRSS